MRVALRICAAVRPCLRACLPHSKALGDSARSLSGRASRSCARETRLPACSVRPPARPPNLLSDEIDAGVGFCRCRC
ncbi:hypothetical protein GUJ93_ZPchr0006g45173 [Zizania palustris]|uniref:Uncharacterized protein n=1 Tax=Zizania palustris TaxID=103762 RepID=A0A8J5TCJ7_ZIZPA|nr:hypothetical protein GUJ93_ZPchr0006g45173 [Zizania palustris]